MRSTCCGALILFLVLAGFNFLRSQDPDPTLQAQDQFFTGTVTELNDTSVTVTRTALGTESTVHRFAIKPDTHIEGKLKLKARVTVRFVEEDEVDRAVRIIVRGASAAPAQPKKQ